MMKNLQNVIDERFVSELLDNLKAIGVPLKSVRAILIEGSALYIDQPNDIDFKVIVEWRNPKAEIGRTFDIKGYKVECTHYTLEEWNSVDKSSRIFYYVTESPDMILVYGSDEGFKRYDVVNDAELAEKVFAFYDKYLFNYIATSAGRTCARFDGEQLKMPDKRLWNFLLFAYKLINKSHTLTAEQMKAAQDAHNLKSSIEDYRDLFNSIKRRFDAREEIQS